MVLFEVPTGVVADTWGRRVSYLLGTLTLAGSTLLYYFMWQTSAPVLGVGDRLGADRARLHVLLRRGRGVARRRAHTSPGYDGQLETVFGRGQMVGGVAMLGGSVAGGVIAQATSLGVPFLLRVGVLCVMFARRVRGDAGRRLHARARPPPAAAT